MTAAGNLWWLNGPNSWYILAAENRFDFKHVLCKTRVNPMIYVRLSGVRCWMRFPSTYSIFLPKSEHVPFIRFTTAHVSNSNNVLTSRVYSNTIFEAVWRCSLSVTYTFRSSIKSSKWSNSFEQMENPLNIYGLCKGQQISAAVRCQTTEVSENLPERLLSCTE